MLRRCGLRAKTDTGLYFPVKLRVLDTRHAIQCADEVSVLARHRRELRSSFTTGETRQTTTPAWSERQRPTHFIALTLPARNGLVGQVRAMYKNMVFANRHIEPLLVPLAKLHVTLGVLTLPAANDTQATLQDIHTCMQAACRQHCTQPLQLRFRGLGTFGHGRVLFVRCTAERQFTRLDNLVREMRKVIGVGLGIDMKGNPYDSYVPHITVAKIRTSQQAEYGTQLPHEVWADYQHHDFGDVSFARVDLCNMRGVGEDGYYKVEATTAL